LNRAEVLIGDCLHVMAQMEACSVDAIVTDPPYELGFMGKAWDASGVAFRVDVWREARRVLKPGGHLLAFSGSRTYHRMACAIEDAGFEIRDQIMWVYGSGFPKSHNLNGEWSGWGTALKPAHEPIVVARKPMVGTVAHNVLAHGTGALNIDGCRVGTELSGWNGLTSKVDNSTSWHLRGTGAPTDNIGRWPANLIHDGSDEVVGLFPDTGPAKRGERKANGQCGNRAYGDFNGMPGRIGGHEDAGGSAARFFYSPKASKADRDEGLPGKGRANHHPTVKPTDLMRYLCRLVTPPSGLVLDPFTGSGSTGKGAVLEGFRFLGIELSPEYAAIARARIRHAVGHVAPEPVPQHVIQGVPVGQLRLFA